MESDGARKGINNFFNKLSHKFFNSDLFINSQDRKHLPWQEKDLKQKSNIFATTKNKFENRPINKSRKNISEQNTCSRHNTTSK